MLTQTLDTNVDSVASSSPWPGVPFCPSSPFLIKPVRPVEETVSQKYVKSKVPQKLYPYHQPTGTKFE